MRELMHGLRFLYGAFLFFLFWVPPLLAVVWITSLSYSPLRSPGREIVQAAFLLLAVLSGFATRALRDKGPVGAALARAVKQLDEEWDRTVARRRGVKQAREDAVLKAFLDGEEQAEIRRIERRLRLEHEARRNIERELKRRDET
jgi:hypothetical protein